MPIFAMRWVRVFLQKQNKGIDRLGNKVNAEYEDTAEIKGRITPWTPEEVQLYGGEVIENRQKVSLPGRIRVTEFIAINAGKPLKVHKVEYTTRWTIIECDKWRGIQFD